MWVSGAADRSENWGFGELVFRGAPEGCGGAGDLGKRPVEELLVPHCFFLLGGVPGPCGTCPPRLSAGAT